MTRTFVRSWINIGREGRWRCRLAARLLLALTAMAGCAQMEAPSGGPADQTPPAVVEHHPVSGASRVPLLEPIVVTFSERMDRASVADALFISPRPAQAPDLRWHGSTLKVQLESGLETDQTYVFTLGVGCKDLRNNEMSSSYSFAFSTGQAVDQGSIWGQVYQDHIPRKGVTLWAYRLKDGRDPKLEADQADYITQTDDKGHYRLSHLGPGGYRIFALDDRNGDQSLQAEEEPIGVPCDDALLNLEVLEVRLEPFRLALLDTTGPSLKEVEVSHRHQLVLTFDQPLDSLLAADPGSYHIVASQGEPDSVDIRAVSLVPNRPDQVILSTAAQQRERNYRIVALGMTNRSGHLAAPGSCWGEFRGTDRPDTIGPHLASYWPPDSAQAVLPGAELWLWFDEAVEKASLEEAVSLVDSLGQKLPGGFRWWHGAAVSFCPDPVLPPGRAYILNLDAAVLADLAGNVMGTSPLASLFRTAPADLPGSLSGTVRRGSYPAQAPAIIRAFGPRPDGSPIETACVGEEFQFPALLPGRYLLSCFLDLNGDGRLGWGHPHPYVPAEPWWISQDSVSVRSRWETAGVEVSFER